MARAEDPPSRIRHLVSNLEAAAPGNGEVPAKTKFLAYRSQLKTDQQRLSSCREEVSRKMIGGWKVARGMIALDANVRLTKARSAFL